MTIETYKLKGWDEKETGLLIAENDDWILTKHIPIDYVIDGYKLYAKKHLKKRKIHKNHAQISRVLTLKNVNTSIPENFVFGNSLEILSWSETTFGLFEFQENQQGDLFYGKLYQSHDDDFMIHQILADGSIDHAYNCDFSLSKIRCITFHSDYFTSIRLLMLDTNKEMLSIVD